MRPDCRDTRLGRLHGIRFSLQCGTPETGWRSKSMINTKANIRDVLHPAQHFPSTNMKLLLLAALCAAVAAQSLGVAVIKPNSVVSAAVGRAQNVDGSQDIAIDVTTDLADQYGDENIIQVNMTLAVVQRLVSLNGNPVNIDALSSLRFTAKLFSISRVNGAILDERDVSVLVQVSIVAGEANGAPILNVQELLREIDGTRIITVGVQEAVITLDENGSEVDRVVSTIAIGESRIPTTTTTVAPATEEGDSPKSPNSPDSPNSPNSPAEASPMTSSGWHHHWRHDCAVARWYRRQSFAVRVLVAAAFSFLVVMAIYVLCRLCVACCTPAAKSRSVYLNNVKMHYTPLATDEKKPVMLV
eukprot:m.170425 g.170425  ORF g.170425 m.170425 type:complete len:358 (-) comp9926_c0_seq3:54-1127(-)